MKASPYPISWLAAAFLVWSGAANAADTHETQKLPYDKLVGIWSEDCRAKPMIIITPEYHAIVNTLRDTERAIGLGKIERLDVKGDEITIIFSASFLHQIGEAQPKYKLSGKNEILSVRDAQIWKQSDRMYREDPSSQPANYVSLNDHEYGMKYYRCAGDRAYIDEKMRQIVVDNEQWLESQKENPPDELTKLCSENVAKLRNILSRQASGLTLDQAVEVVEADADPRIKSFLRTSVGVAYPNPDELRHALDSGAWLKACVNNAKAH